MPRRIGRTRLCDHLIDRSLVFIPLFTVTPVFIRDLPLFLRCILPVRKTGKLGIFVNLYPEFNNDSAPVMKFLLKLVDFIIGTHPVIFTAESLQTFDHDSSIPCTVKNRNMSGFWQSRPETPQIMSCLLMRLRTCNRMHLVSTRIECSGNPFDISAFSRSIPAFVGNDHRHFLAVQTIVQFAKALLQLL